MILTRSIPHYWEILTKSFENFSRIAWKLKILENSQKLLQHKNEVTDSKTFTLQSGMGRLLPCQRSIFPTRGRRVRNAVGRPSFNSIRPSEHMHPFSIHAGVRSGRSPRANFPWAWSHCPRPPATASTVSCERTHPADPLRPLPPLHHGRRSWDAPESIAARSRDNGDC